jgi:hypothetical protein
MKISQTNNVKFPELFISVNRNRIKHYVQDQKIVTYLKPGTEFELEFNNKTDSCWLAKILINDKPISDSGLVLSPGEHTYLERYLDSPKKFKADIYSVDDVAETQTALQQNGKIVVQFFKEIVPTTTTWIYRPHPWPYSPVRRQSTPWWGTHEITYTSGGSVDSDTLKMRTRSTKMSAQSKGINESFAPDTSVMYCASVDIGNMSSPKTVETARVEEGSHSNQNFNTVYKQWELFPSFAKVIQILPISRKDITSQEINTVRQYCGDCGVKISNKDNYCYKCGAKL